MKTISYFIGVCVIPLYTQCSFKSSAEIKTQAPAESSIEMTKEYVTTFQIEKPDRIVVEYYSKMSQQYDNTAVPKRSEITDEPTIARVVELAKLLPDRGEIMKKMADGPLLHVQLLYQNRILYFDYYGETIKTPDTSFYAKAPSEEKRLYDLLISMLQ